MCSIQGKALSSCLRPMSLKTQTALSFLQEPLLGLRANNTNACKRLLSLDLQDLGLNIVDQRTMEFLMPLLSETEAEQMMDWSWGLSL